MLLCVCSSFYKSITVSVTAIESLHSYFNLKFSKSQISSFCIQCTVRVIADAYFILKVGAGSPIFIFSVCLQRLCSLPSSNSNRLPASRRAEPERAASGRRWPLFAPGSRAGCFGESWRVSGFLTGLSSPDDEKDPRSSSSAPPHTTPGQPALSA